jgi:hypothetical protein
VEGVGLMEVPLNPGPGSKGRLWLFFELDALLVWMMKEVLGEER